MQHSSAAWYVLLLAYVAQAAVQNTVPEAGRGFDKDMVYFYDYTSSSRVYDDLELTVECKVLLSLLQSDSSLTELAVHFENVSLTWHTKEGHLSETSDPVGDLSKWFSITLDENGAISDTHSSPEEVNSVLAFKKAIANMIGVSGDVEHVMDGTNIVVTERVIDGDVTGSKTLTFNEDALLFSVEVDERASGSPLNDKDNPSSTTPLFGYPLYSHTSLILIRNSPGGVVKRRPDDMISGSIEIEKIKDILPLSQLLPTLSSTLDSCTSTTDTAMDTCIKSLVAILQQLTSKDVAAFIEAHFTDTRLDVHTPGRSKSADQDVALVGALARLMSSRSSSAVGNTLARNVLGSSRDTSLVSQVLTYFTTGRFLPGRISVDAVLGIAMGNEVYAPSNSPLTRQAMLALGGMSKSLRETDPELANEIIDTLHGLLDQQIGGSHVHEDTSRLRRSAPFPYDPVMHATVIDSLGNAQSERSLPRLSRHVTESRNNVGVSHDLSIRHAAVNALRGLESEESAQALLQAAESSPHPSVRHLSASAYQSHTRRTRDLSHIIMASSHHRSKRQLAEPDSHVTNVTMPTVTWSQQFGESNISVDVRRTLRNSFDIATAPLSSQYTFSLHDTTSFDANLLLSSGEQHSEMLRTEVCLQGTASYDTNVLTKLNYNLTSHQFNRHIAAVPNLQEAFRDSYTQITTSEAAYSGLGPLLETSLSNLPSRFALIQESLDDYSQVVDGIDRQFVLKTQADDLFSSLNQTFVETRILALGSVQFISDALASFLPSLPEALSSSLLVDGQPFTDSTFYVPYLPFAPQQAMANIFNIRRRAESAFSSLESSIHSLLNLTGSYGTNHVWLTPSIYLRSRSSELSSLSLEIREAIDTAEKCIDKTYDGATLSELRTLQTAVDTHLQTTLSLLEGVGSEVLERSQQISSTYRASKEGILSLQLAYDKARSAIDTIFGPKFHPNFPRRLRPCNLSCGSFPSTFDGQYSEGVDLILQTDQIVAPFSSYVRSLDTTSLPNDLRALYTSQIGSLIIPAEPSLSDVRIILSNFDVASSVVMSTDIVQSGEVISGSLNISPSDTSPYVHVEAFQVQNGVWFRIDPTPFVQPVSEPQVGVDFECNDIIVYVGGLVVERRSLLSSADVFMEMIGDPLVQGIPDHEFPQPHDLVVRDTSMISSSPQGMNNSELVFFQSSTFVMVGPIPVQFDFSSVGSYQISYSPSINLLSKSLNLPLTPYFHARAQGSMKVGTTVFALVDFSGTLLETTLPLVLTQDFSQWPQSASSAMDVILVPSTVTLASQLVQLTGAGEFADQEIRETNTLWEYSIPPFNRNEFYYRGLLTDQTPPLFTPLEYTVDQSECFVRQLPGRFFNNPAFEIEFNVTDPESLLNVSYRVGTFVNGNDILEKTELASNRIVVPDELISGEDIFFTISAENLNGDESFATCKLPGDTYYDRSPPQARIVPIRQVSSHPSMIQALVVLFDEVGFDDSQEIAIGSVPGVDGYDVLGWRVLNASLTMIRPNENGDILNLFSFGRSGRLVGDILQSVSSIDDLSICATMCHSNAKCLSFDYSRQESTCILHDNIEGPNPAYNNLIQLPFQAQDELEVENFENIFSTPQLQVSETYSHYEKLGVGNSTLVEFSGLSFDHNRVYYINMRLKSRLLVENFASSQGFLVDLTPPTPGRIRNASMDEMVVGGCTVGPVIAGCIDNSGLTNHRIIVDGPGSATIFNGPTPLLDSLYTSTSNYITANWNGFSDAESGLFAFTWCIGTSIGSCDLLSPRDPHARLGLTTRESWTSTGLASSLNLTDGSYYITVQAISNVEYGGPLATTVQHSTPYIIDTSPPNITEVNNILYNGTTSELSLEYVVLDEGSGVANVSLAIGRTPRDTSLLGWTNLQLGGSGLVTVVIPDGVPSWVKLRAINNAGLRSVAVAEDSIVVDRTPPLHGIINDGAVISLDTEYQSSLDTICVNWEGFSDPESGIASIVWSIGRTNTFDSGFTARPLSPIEIASRVACTTGLSLVHNTTYYSFLMFTNGAMNSQSNTGGSNGVRTDNTPPSTGTVSDGPDPTSDLQFSSSQTTLSTTWSGFNDYESGIESYTITVFQQPMGSVDADVVYGERVPGNVEQISWNYFSFSNGDLIFVQIESTNGAGLTVAQNSSGYTIDLTPPELLFIIDGINPSSDESFQSSFESYSVSWSVLDVQSGISRIEGAIFELQDSHRVRIYPNPILTDSPTDVITVSASSWSVNNLQLESGSRYIAALTFTNGAGLRSMFETNGVIVDLTPPVIELVSIMSDIYIDSNAIDTTNMISNPSQINVRWSGLDPESGIAEYRIAVVDENLALITPYVIFEGSLTGGLIENVSLTPGNALYSIVVVAVNMIGRQSDPVYSRHFRVTEGDSAGVVIDGDNPELIDIDYTNEVTAVTAQFYGFVSVTCGGISRYEWAVGVANDEGGVVKDNVVAFTTRGIVSINPPGSGYAQLPVPNLASYEGEQLFITVRGINDCGGILESTSNGFVIVTRSPSLRIIDTGSNAIERAQSGDDVTIHNEYQSTLGYSSIWENDEDDSRIVYQNRVRVGTYPGGDDIQQEQVVLDSYVRGRVLSPEGVPLFVTVATENSAGLESVAISNPVVLDTSPPSAEELACSILPYPTSPQILNNDDSIPKTGVLSCDWNGISDPESGIATLAISVGTSQTDQSVLSKKILTGCPSLNSYQSPPMTFDPDELYYAVLYVTNGAGLESIAFSRPFCFNISPLIIQGAVVVQSNVKSAEYTMGRLTNQTFGSQSEPAVCLHDTDTVDLIILLNSDSKSGEMFTYKVGIGTSPGKDNLLEYQLSNPIPTPSTNPLFGDDTMQFTVKLKHVNLSPAGSQGVFFNIRVCNENRIHSVLSSNPIFVKSDTVLEGSWVFDGNIPGQDINFQTSTTEYKGQAHINVNCPLRSAQWAIECVDGTIVQQYRDIDTMINFADNFIESQNVFFMLAAGLPMSFENSFHFETDQVELGDSEVYRILFNARDYCGNRHNFRSDGVRVTTATLEPGLVRDGLIPGQDLNYQESTSELAGQWSGFGDGSPEQEIDYYEVAAGSDREYQSTRSDIAPFTRVGLNTSHLFTNLNLVPESVVYYITVRAYAVSGAFVDATSNGISAGYGQEIIQGDISLERFQSDTSMLNVYWSEFESDVPIRSYELAFGSTRFDEEQLEEFCDETNSDFSTEFDVFGFTAVDLDTYATVGDLSLSHNTTYYVVLRVLDQAKKCLAVITEDGILIDTTAPVFEASSTFVEVGTETSRAIEISSESVVYVSANERIEVSWESFSDLESNVARYEVAIFSQTVCGNSSAALLVVKDFVSVDEEQEASFDGVDLVLGVPYVVAVRATNNVGLSSVAYSLPFIVDSFETFEGDVKDGLSWEDDITFQSDLSMLGATFTHAKLPHPTPGVTMNGPCPNTTLYKLTELDPAWSITEPVNLIGLFSTSIVYAQSQVNQSTNGPSGVTITARRDEGAVNEQILSGAYQTQVPLSNGGIVSLDILAAQGRSDFVPNAVTSVLFIDSGMESDVVAIFEPESDFEFPDSADFSAFGLQIYHESTDVNGNTEPPRVVLWTRSGDPFGTPVYVSHDLSHLNLSQVHTYTLDFQFQQLSVDYTRRVDLYIDGSLETSLFGLPAFTDSTRIVLHLFNKLGYIPPVSSVFDIPRVRAVFGNVSLPLSVGHLCDYGNPFFSRGSPVVEFRAWAGRRPGGNDIVEFQTISSPCLTCLPTTPCPSFGCDPNCTMEDPYIIPILFTNLTLAPGYTVQTNQSDGEFGFESTNGMTSNTLSSLVTNHFQPAVYFVTVEATTASGYRFRATSNGVTIDTTPPILDFPIDQFDVSFSLTEPTRFQGNDNAIAAAWSISDLQSGVVEYQWAIGTTPYGDDTQTFESVGMATSAINTQLSSNLQDNTTYYVTVLAINSAGLSANVTSDGITYIATELNVTELESFVILEFTDVVLTIDGDNGTQVDVVRVEREDRASVRWEGVGEDVEEIFWSIGSEDREDDIFPRTEVSFNNSQSATINQGVLFLNDQPFANVSEVVALADGREENPANNEFFFEPGRLLYHSLELCNFVHRCSIVETSPAILIRTKDILVTSRVLGEQLTITSSQQIPPGTVPTSLPTLDKGYTVTLATTGLDPGSKIATGFLNQSDVTQSYRVATPYISNPFETMAQTSREIARRFTEVGGPSFFVSFLGQESLSGSLEVNVTFDGSLDWVAAIPELAYWDIDEQVWREVGATCMNDSTVDWPTLTISVQVCSTVLSPSSITRPASLSRRRRQSGNDPNFTLTSGMGSGMNLDPDPTFTPLNFLDRPTQFIVIRVGNTSTNTPPRLNLTVDPLIISEGGAAVEFQLEYTDAELDLVDFYLNSLPKLGNATISLDGLLRYEPCSNCIGMDSLDILIVERPFGASHTPLSATGRLFIQIQNVNDIPEVYFYNGDTASNRLTVNRTITAYIDGNRTNSVIVARIAGFDFDGYNDDLEVFVQNGQYGTASYTTWLDAVNVPESLPISFSDGAHSVEGYNDYITFVGAYVTYLPSDSNFAGVDEIMIRVQDSNFVLSVALTLRVEVLPSLCENGGICGGSLTDPDCTDISTRKVGFEGYNCSCLPGFGGQYCEFQTSTPSPEVVLARDCPLGTPLVQCDGDPCDGAVCPSHPEAMCNANFCGECTAQWSLSDGTPVSCHADIPGICDSRAPGIFPSDCLTTTCDCPFHPFQCPEDSILVETRVNDCCVTFECICPNISCPYLMECGHGVQPIPSYRGNQFPGRCCPSYDYVDVNECMDSSQNLCSDTCVNRDNSYSCSCPSGTTLARNEVSCGVCPYDGMEYLLGDRVKIGCNWCICRGDDLSGERWHCTAVPCERGCISDGQLHPLGRTILRNTLSCSCEATDTSAEWSCNLATT